jgi:sterol desaturase/sphingolipid hydroxylase (fatty acid hydroxylase superfamily)
MSTQDFLATVFVILTVMAVAAAVELAVPLYTAARGARRRANLAMTAQALLSAHLFTTAVAAAALYLPSTSPGWMAAAGLPMAAQFVLGIVSIDLAHGYVAHRSMHAWPALWKFHRVHHSDAFVDVTTSYRTHFAEVAWRHAWMFATVWLLGVPAAAVVTFRLLSAVNGIFEHANIRVRPALDAAISRIWVTPNMHKVHHSREQRETDSNYGNLLSLHDRLFGTFTPTAHAFSVTYGLDEVDPSEGQSFGALVTMPWRSKSRPHGQAPEIEAAA